MQDPNSRFFYPEIISSIYECKYIEAELKKMEVSLENENYSSYYNTSKTFLPIRTMVAPSSIAI